MDWVDASPRVARNNCAVGPVVQKRTKRDSRRAHDCDLLGATSAHRAPSGAYAARACQLLHRLCNIVCLFLASIGTQTDAAVMTDNRIVLP